MHIKSTYKKMLATSFLLLYVFIYMPVQLWHQHDAVNKIPASSKFAKAVVDSLSEDCSICQHTYTAYINDNSLFEVCENELVILNKPVLFINFTSALIDKASNKGPPVV
jgi:hypothetical protein